MSIFGFKVKTQDGSEVTLSDYKGRVTSLLIVNTVAGCGFTPQYDVKEALNKSPHPSWRQIFRPASLKNLEIHKVFLQFFSSRCMKICPPIRAR